MRTLATHSLFAFLIAVALGGCKSNDPGRGGTGRDSGRVGVDAGGGEGEGEDSGGGPGVDAGGEGEGEDAGVNCGERTSCGACTPTYPCGWCPGTSTCMVGTSEGPATGTCDGWAWLTSECPDYDAGPPPPPPDCTDGTDCASCTPMGGCGWCVNGSTGACLNGTGDGPTMGTCTGWAWLSSECAMPPPPTPPSM